MPGCVCERFEPVPEIAADEAVSGWGAAAIPTEEARRPHLWQERDTPPFQARVHGDRRCGREHSGCEGTIAVARDDAPAYPATAPAASEPELSRRPPAPPAVQPPWSSPGPGHPPRGADRETGQAWDHRHPPHPRWYSWPSPWGPYYPYPYAHPSYRPPVPTWVPGHWEWNGWQRVWEPGHWRIQ